MNTNKKATRSSSKRLLAALAVLAVALVMLAAVPAVATDSDAATVSLTAPTNSATATDVSAVSDITGYDKETGIVTLTDSANWTLKADITIKGLVLKGNNLTITSYNEDGAKTKAVYTLTIQNNDNSVFLLDTAGKSALLSIQGANLSIIDNASEMQGADTPSTGKNRSNVGSLYLDADDAEIMFSSSAAGHKFSTGNAVIDLKDSELTETTVGGMAGAWYLKMEKSTFTATGATYTDASVYIDAKDDSKIVAGNLNIYAGKLVDSTISANTIGFYAGSAAPSTVFTDSTLSLRMLEVDEDSVVKSGTFYSNAFSASGEVVGITGAGSVTGDLAFVLDTVSNGKAVQRINTAGFSLSGVTFNGTASYTDGGITSTATLTNVVGNSTTPLVVSAGSIELKGTINADDVDTTQDITVTGDAKLDGTLTIPEGVTLTVAPGATLTVDSTNKLVLDDEDSLVLEEDDDGNAGVLNQTSAGAVTVGSKLYYKDGSSFTTTTGQVYKVHTIAVGDVTVVYGIAVQDIVYTGAVPQDKDLVAMTMILDGVDKVGVALSDLSGFNVTFGDFSVTGDIEAAPGQYTDVISTQVQATDGTFTARKMATADLTITKIVLDKTMIEVDPLIYTGSELNPVFTIKSGDVVLSSGEYEVSYGTDVKVLNAGTYTATFKVKANAAFFTAPSAGVEFIFKVAQAVPVIGLTVPESWNFGALGEKDAYVTMPSTYTGAVSVKTATTLGTDGKPVYGTAITLTMNTEDKVYYLYSVLNTIGSLTETKDVTVYIQVSAAAETGTPANYKAAVDVSETVTVKPFVSLEDYISFSEDKTTGTIDYDQPAVSQDGYDVVLSGQLTDRDSTANGYEYVLKFTMTVDKLVGALTFSGDSANAKFSDVDKVTVVPGSSTATTGDAVYLVTVTITSKLPVAQDLTLTVTASETETKYTTQTYTISLASLIPSDFKVVLSEDGRVKDITVLVEDAAKPFVILPATATQSYWTLGSTTYQPGSVYIIDAADMVEGVITFTATGSSLTPVEPDEPVIDYSSNMAVSVAYDADAGTIYFVAASFDGKAVPTGTTVKVAYSYLVEDDGEMTAVTKTLDVELAYGAASAYGSVDAPAGVDLYTIQGAFTYGTTTLTSSTIYA